MFGLNQKLLKARYEILTVYGQKYPSHVFSFVFVSANILGVYFEWARSCDPLFYLDLGMVICGVGMIFFSRKSSKFRERYFYILFLFIGVLLEFETMARDPAGDFDDPRIGYANTLIMILTCISFPEKPVIFRSIWISFYLYFYFRFSLVELSSFNSNRFWVMGTYYIPTYIFTFAFNHYWFRLKMQSIKQTHIILILQKKLIAKERKEVVRDMHDFLGGGLTDLVQISNSLKPGQVLDEPVINTIKRAIIATISKLRSRLQYHEEEKLLNEDFLLGFKMILNRRYEISRRKIRFQIQTENQEDFQIKIPIKIRGILLPVLSEVVTNDLKYGEGDSDWTMKLDSQFLFIQLSTTTIYHQNNSYGLGKNHLAKRLSEIGGEILETFERTHFELLMRIPI